VIITASAANEVSVERTICSTAFSPTTCSKDCGQGRSGPDSMITVDEAYRYVYDSPRATARSSTR